MRGEAGSSGVPCLCTSHLVGMGLSCANADRVAAAVERLERAAMSEALLDAASRADRMEYPASPDPHHWATWLRNRAAAVFGPEGER